MSDRTQADRPIPAEEIYATVLRKIKENACVLFLGPMAALSRPDAQSPWVPLSVWCARRIAARFGLPVEQRLGDNLVHVASMLRLNNLCGDLELQEEVQSFYQEARQYDLHPFLEHLAELPFPIVINTAPDDAFARLLRASAHPLRSEFYNFYKPSGDLLNYDPQSDRRTLVYNLLGAFSHAESMVLTYKHQLDYVKKITANQHERLPESLSNAFKSTPYQLFLGFDFDDWSLRMILDNLFKNVRGNIRPIAYRQAGAPETSPADQVFFRSEFGMQFPAGVSMEDFVEEIYQRHESGVEEGTDSGTGRKKAKALVLYDEAADQEGYALVEKYLKAIHVQPITLRDALGAGDVEAWLLKMMDACQIILPLASVHLFSPAHPAFGMLPEIARRNRPRKGLLVMPIVLREMNLADTPLGQLPTIRPLDSEALLGKGKEHEHLMEISAALRDYIDSLPDTP